MKKSNLTSVWSVGLALAGLFMGLNAQATPITKADNTNALGTAASWVGGVAPGATDIATWSGAYSASPDNPSGLTNSLRTLGSAATAHSWQGIAVGSLTGTALTTNTFYSGVSGFGAETNIQAASQSGNIVTITTRAAHGFAPGMSVTIAGVTPAGYNGTFTVLGIPSGTTFTYSTGAGLAAGTAFGTVAGAIYIGGTGNAPVGSTVTIGSSGIDLSSASHSVAIAADNAGSGFSFAGNQTWNIAAGRNLRLGRGGISAASAKVTTSGSDGIIDISGNGVADANQGGASGFGDVAGFAGFTGKWRINSGATLRGLRHGATAWGSNPDADSIILNGGTLAVGGMSGAVGNWAWTNGITLVPSTTSSIDEQNVAGTSRSLLLNGAITGSGNLIFKDTAATSTFTSQDLGFILTGANTMSGTVTIGGPVENGIAGRLSFVRVGGVGGISTSTGIGGLGSLGTATIVNNGVLTFSLNTSITVNTISGTGSMRVGYTATAGAESQNVSLTGVNTYSGDTRINMGTLTLPAGASIPNTANIFVTPLTAASFITATLDVSGAGGITLGSGQRLVGGANNAGLNNTAQVSGNVTAGTGSAIVPGGTNVVNTLAINGNLNLPGGATLAFDVNNSAADLLTVYDLNPSGVTTLLITPPGGGLFAGDYTLITPSGTLGGSAANFALAGLVSAGRGQTFSVIYDAGSVKLRVIGSPAELIWQGDGVANVWDDSITTNWINAGNPDAFFAGDQVIFDGSGSSSPAVNLTGSLQANVITVTGSQNYIFAGSGKLTGGGLLTNIGPGTLSIVTSNDFTGKTILTGGTLSITNESALGANPAVFTADSLVFDGGALTLPVSTFTFSRANRGITVGANGGTLNLPGALAVDLTNRIAGSGALTKSGTGLLNLLATNNAFTGFTIVSNGSVKLGNAYGAGGSGVFGGKLTVKQGTFDINGMTMYANNGQASEATWLHGSAATLTLGGGAPGSTAQLIDSTGVNGFGVYNAYPNPSIQYDATGDPGTATISAFWKMNGQSTLSTNRVDVGDSASTLVELDITGGMSRTDLLEGKSTTIQKTGPGTMRISSPNAFPVLQILDGTLLVNHLNALGQQHTWSNFLNSANLVIVDGGTLDLNGFGCTIGSLAGLGGTVVNNGGAPITFTIGNNDTNIVIGSYDGVIANGANSIAIVKTGDQAQTLGGANTYTGGTTVSNGTLLVNGSIVSGATVRSGGTLGGNGTISGVVTVNAGGTLSAGASIGTLTLNSSPVLNGKVYSEVDRNSGTPLADLINVSGNPIAYNGTLVVTNTGAPLQAGDTFTLFSASGYSGGFTLVSQTPGQVITWNTANLTVNGSISVATVAPVPITGVVNGGNLDLSWPLEAAGAQLQVQTNSLAVGISTNWSGVPGSTGVNALSVPIDPANPTVFLRLVYPPQP